MLSGKRCHFCLQLKTEFINLYSCITFEYLFFHLSSDTYQFHATLFLLYESKIHSNLTNKCLLRSLHTSLKHISDRELQRQVTMILRDQIYCVVQAEHSVFRHSTKEQMFSFNSPIFATQCCKLLTFQTMNSIR